MIEINSHIPSGNIIYDRVDSDGIVHLNLNKEFNSFTHWFYFKVLLDKISKKHLSFSIDNANQSAFAKGWNNYAPYASLDGKNWKRTKQGNLSGSSFNFEIDNYDEEFFVSWYSPYPLDKYYSWLNQVSNSLQIIKEGTLPDYITLGDKSKPALVFVSRQHSGETMASFVVEGFVNSLIEQKELTEKLLDNFSIIIFPLLNKSGAEKGYHRVNANGNDLNRSWNNNSVEEIKFVKNVLASFASIHSIIDIHGDEVSNFNYVYYNENFGNGFQQIFLNSLKNSSPTIAALPKQQFLKRFLKQLIRKGKILTETGLTLSDFGKKEYNARTYTIEVSAKVTSDKECKIIGQNILSSIVQTGK